MRNVTIVESNVEPNKEHLWFYNGKLKWFGPNGWEDVCVCKFPSPSSTTTTTPKPVVTTTTTTSTPKPGPTPLPNSINFINRTNVPLTLTRVNWVDDGLSFPPIQSHQQYIYVHNANDANSDSYIEIHAESYSDSLLPFSSLKITAFNNEGQEYDVPYEHYQDAMGTNLYKFSFKELINKGVTEVSIYGSLENSTTTTSTTPPTFKLINNTGDTLQVMGYGYVEDEISTGIPYVPNGGSVLLAKISEQETITLHSLSNYRLGIIIDGEDKGELSSYSTYYGIPRSIFINANEISVYSVGA
jgi:hypothetical protein